MKYWLWSGLLVSVMFLSIVCTSCTKQPEDTGPDISTSLTAGTTIASTILYVPAIKDDASEYEIKSYDLSTSEFITRVENLDWDLDACYGSFYSQTSGSQSILCESWYMESPVREEGLEGEFWIGTTYRIPVYSPLLRLFGNSEHVSQLLAANDIDVQVLTVAIVCSELFPVTAVLKTNQGTLFITINERELGVSSDYVYRMYESNEFERYFLERTFTLCVKGKLLDLPQKVLNSTFMLSSLSILKELNVGVTERDDRILLSYNNKVYILDLGELTLTEEKSSQDLIPIAPGNIRYWEDLGGEVLMDSTTLSQILKAIEVEADIFVDEENMEVVIQ